MTSARITTRLDLIKQRVDMDGVATTLQTMVDQLQQLSTDRDWLRRVLIAGNNENITVMVPVKGADE
jgi:chorismate-pyruvate lyase